MLLSEEITRVVFPLTVTQQQSCCPQRIWLVPVLLLLNRIDDINLTTCLEHEFCVHRMFIEVCGAFPPFLCVKILRLNALTRWKRGWQVSLNLCFIFAASEFQFSFLSVNRISDSFPTPDQRMSHVFTRFSSRNSWLSRHSKYNCHHFLSS